MRNRRDAAMWPSVDNRLGRFLDRQGLFSSGAGGIVADGCQTKLHETRDTHSTIFSRPGSRHGGWRKEELADVERATK